MPALISSASLVADGTHATGTTSAIDTTGASLLAIVVGSYSGSAGTITVSDNKGNTWTGLTAQSGANTKVRIYYAWGTGLIVGSGHTFTVSSTIAIYHSACVAAFSGIQTSADPFDTQNGAFSNSATSLSTGSAGASGNLMVAGLSSETANTKSISTGTITNSVGWANGVNESSTLAYKVQTGADNPSWSWAGAITDVTAVIASFKAGTSTTDGAGSSDGVGAVTGAGAGVIAGAGSLSGVGAASAAGGGIAAGAGTSSGTSTVSAASNILSGDGSSAGVATVSGVGLAIGITSGDGSSAGVSTITGSALGLASSDGLIAGTSTVLGASPNLPARFYFPSTGTPPLSSLAYDTGWTDVAGGTSRFPGQQVRVSTSAAFPSAISVTSSPEFHAIRQYQFKSLLAQTISGTVKGQVRSRTDGAFKGTLALAIRVVSSTGAARGVLLAPTASPTITTVPPRFATSSTNRKFRDVSDSATLTLTPVTVLNDDILIIEIGARSEDPSPGDFCELAIGTSSATDLAEDETTTTANNPWIEFSTGPTFVQIHSGAGACSGIGAVTATTIAITLAAGTCTGTSDMVGEPPGVGKGHGLLAGASTVAGTGSSTAEASGHSTGFALVRFAIGSVTDGAGTCAGVATVLGDTIRRKGTGVAAGISDVFGTSVTILEAAGISGGTSTDTALSAVEGPLPTSGLIQGTSTLLGGASGAQGSAAGAFGSSAVIAVGQAGRWPESVRLNTAITDDGWGGALTYLWTQISGPATATIVSPTSSTTEVFFAQVAGVYVFELATTRALDGLVGRVLMRIRVYTPSVVESTEPTDPGTVTITANGIPHAALINSVRISDSNGQSSTCMFTMIGESFEVGSEIILERYGVRLFGGLCLSLGVTKNDGVISLNPSLVGYAWHLGRFLVNKKYVDWLISSIVADLLAGNPAGITLEYAAQGLPVVTIAFTDTYISDALTQLTKFVRGAHWRVDAYKRLHFAVTEPANDPQPITSQHRTLRNLSTTRSLGLVANRLKIYYKDPQDTSVTVERANVKSGSISTSVDPVTHAVTVDVTEIEVESFKGYTLPTGTFILNGVKIRYGNTEIRRSKEIFGAVSFNYTHADAVEGGGGELGPTVVPAEDDPTKPRGYGVFINRYWLSLSTPDGETPLMQSFSGLQLQNGWTGFVGNGQDTTQRVHQSSVEVSVLGPTGPKAPDIPDTSTILAISGPSSHLAPIFISPGYGQSPADVLQAGLGGGVPGPPIVPKLDPVLASRITSINVYRESDEESHPGDSDGRIFLVGSLAGRGGILKDSVAKAHLAPIQEPVTKYTNRADGSHPWDPPSTYWLTNISVVDADNANDTQQTFVIVEDLNAQAAMASRLNVSSGVIELVIQAGTVSEIEARQLGIEYLNRSIAVQTSISCIVKDAAAQPGQVLDMRLPEPFGSASLKIQSTNVNGFEYGILHEQNITAATEVVTLEDLLKH